MRDQSVERAVQSINAIRTVGGRLAIDPLLLGAATIAFPSIGTSEESNTIDKQLRSIGYRDQSESVTTRPKGDASRVWHVTKRAKAPSIAEQLYDALATFKVHTSTVAMHLDRDWRQRFFKQLDSLLGSEDWESDDLPPTLASFATLLRMLLVLKPRRRPGLSATSDGHLLASWTVDDDRLTIECLPHDRVRWLVSRPFEGEIEYGSGLSDIVRLPAILHLYDLTRWFGNANDLRPT